MEPATQSDSLYRVLKTDDGTLMLPTALTSGPWNAEHQHGGAVAGLLTGALDQIESPAPMRLARITLEMFRGVPVEPLRIVTEIIRGGRRIQSVEARLFHGDVLVARATGLRIRTDESIPEMFTAADRPSDLGEPPEHPTVQSAFIDIPVPPGFIRAVDIQSVRPDVCGTYATLWARLRCPFTEGVDTSPVVRLATLCDFASGTGNAMDYTKYTSINPDLTIHVLREPRSDWIGIRGLTLRAGDGIGQSSAVAYDLEGPIANIQASLLLDRR